MARDHDEIVFNFVPDYDSACRIGEHMRHPFFRGGGYWESKPRVAIPELEVPAPPEEKPEPVSASVQVLRGVLEQRKAELKRFEDRKGSRLKQIEEAEQRAADLRKRVEDDDRHIAAAQAAISDIEYDIGTLQERGAPA